MAGTTPATESRMISTRGIKMIPTMVQKPGSLDSSYLLVCHMLRDRNHIFLSADGAPYRSCHDHGKDTTEDPDADDPAQVHI